MVRKRGERQTDRDRDKVTETKRQRDRQTKRQRQRDRETEHEKNNCETNDIILDTFTSTREVRGMNIYISFCKQIQVCIPYRIHTYTYDKVAIVIIV